MRKIAVAVACFLAVVLANTDAFALLKVDGRYWFTNLDANAKVSKGGVIGTDLDLVKDLGIDDKKNFWEGRITLELGHHKIRYGFTPLKWDGSRTLSQSITFNGRTYSASTTVDTKLNLDYHRLGYEYDFIDLLDNRLGVIVELKYFDADARLKDTSLGIDESKKVRAPIPTVGIGGQVGLPFLFSVGGEVTGITVGKNAYLVDAEAGVNLKPFPFVVISGGYRIFKLHLENNDDKGNVTLKGPFAMLRADF